MKQVQYVLSCAPTAKSERIVVDEILYDGKVRLLRARYAGIAAAEAGSHPLAIANWGTEREYIMSAGLVEAYVGYRSRVHLQEGDVFYIRDGKTLTSRYRPIRRADARRKHLLVDYDVSGKIARADITREYRLLNVTQAAQAKRRQQHLQALVRQAVEIPRQRIERAK